MHAQYTVWVPWTKGDSWPRHGGAGPHRFYFHPQKAHNSEVPRQTTVKWNYKKEKLLLHREKSMEKAKAQECGLIQLTLMGPIPNAKRRKERKTNSKKNPII